MISQIQPFQFKQTQLVSFEFHEACQIVRILLNFFQLIAYTVLVYVLLKQSPASIGAYKWYILVYSTNNMLAGFIACLFQPYTLAPYPVVINYGVFKYLNMPSVAVLILMYLTALLSTGMAFGRVMMFTFRYVQTTGNRYLGLLSDMRFYFLCYCAVQCFVFISTLLPFHLQIMFAEQVKLAMKDVDPKMYQLIVDEPLVFGINPDVEKYYLIGGISATLLVIAAMTTISILTFATHRALKSNRQNLHSNTKNLYSKFLTIQIIDIFMASCVVVVPYFIVIIAQSLKLEWTSGAISLSMIILELYPLLANSIFIFYIKPYRECFLQLLRQIGYVLTIKRLQPLNVITVSRVTQSNL